MERARGLLIVLRPSRAISGQFWSIWEAFLGSLGLSWGHLGRPGGILEAILAVLGRFVMNFEVFARGPGDRRAGPSGPKATGRI